MFAGSAKQAFAVRLKRVRRYCPLYAKNSETYLVSQGIVVRGQSPSFVPIKPFIAVGIYRVAEGRSIFDRLIKGV